MIEKIAILGASGFVGSRLVEHWHLTKKAEVIPIVRSYTNLASFARFKLPWRMADMTNMDSLAKALEGCDSVVHLATGDPHVILSLVEPVYKACQLAKVRRLIFLSSTAVFGQNPKKNTSDWTPVPSRHIFSYNAAKAKAEKQFFKLRSEGEVELVILRPGIVYGPRSSWVTRFVSDLYAGKAYWYNEGQGILNGIFVDNLIHAIEQAIVQPGDGQAFIVSDNEYSKWTDLYTPIAHSLGFGKEAIQNIPSSHSLENNFSIQDSFNSIRSMQWVQKCTPYIPSIMKRILKASIQAIPTPPQDNPWQIPTKPSPQPTHEMLLLHHCNWKLPDTKARELLKYYPPYTFEEGIQSTLNWLHFCGFHTCR